MIIDLRDYTTTPKMRDALIERCESVIFPEQERLGAAFKGIFRDADDPNRFVWLRGMSDMSKRKEVLNAFYTNGEMWASMKSEVNKWIADSDNVLLVRPISDFALPAEGGSHVGMYSYLLKQPLSKNQISEVQTKVTSAIKKNEGRLLVTLEVDSAENNYPRHPIRTGEHGYIWFATFKKYASLKLAEVSERHLLPTKASPMR